MKDHPLTDRQDYSLLIGPLCFGKCTVVSHQEKPHCKMLSSQLLGCMVFLGSYNCTIKYTHTCACTQACTHTHTHTHTHIFSFYLQRDELCTHKLMSTERYMCCAYYFIHPSGKLKLSPNLIY